MKDEAGNRCFGGEGVCDLCEMNGSGFQQYRVEPEKADGATSLVVFVEVCEFCITKYDADTLAAHCRSAACVYARDYLGWLNQ